MTIPAAGVTEDQGFVVKLDEYSGPLDLLLTLIRDQEIDIADIPIAQIADQFMNAIESLGLNQAADYLEMAARLLRIKIQMLLPQPLDADAWEDPRAELVRHLLEYEQIREVVDWLVGRTRQWADRFPRGWQPEPTHAPPRPIALNLRQLMRAVEDVIAGLPDSALHRVVPRPLDVEGATTRIVALLAVKPRVQLRELFGERPSIADVISVLIAVLELARVGRLRLAQPEAFGPVGVERGPTDQAA
ncbi:MAG TPA: ScpA family protein [Gemmatimonadales bacterium]